MILAFDPGLATGWAMYVGSPHFSIKNYWCGQLTNSLTEVYEFLKERKPDLVVYEDFKHRPQLISAEMYSLQVIGVIRLWAEQTDTPVARYLPARTKGKKAFWTDDKIKKLGLWVPGQRHAMDAMRVLLTHRAKLEPDWLTETVSELRETQHSTR